MLIAAQAVEAESVYVYLRDEYAGLRTLLGRELEALRTAQAGDRAEIDRVLATLEPLLHRLLPLCR